jgi:hypothetical protein
VKLVLEEPGTARVFLTGLKEVVGKSGDVEAVLILATAPTGPVVFDVG